MYDLVISIKESTVTHSNAKNGMIFFASFAKSTNPVYEIILQLNSKRRVLAKKMKMFPI